MLFINFRKYFWIIPLVVVLVYNLTFLNRFYVATEGWFSVYAWFFNSGQFPYKDFYLLLTPLYTITISLFSSLFGYSILDLRILGLVVILLMTFFLYKNFEILFGRGIAVFVAIFGMIYYQSNNAHITYDFIQFVTLYALIQSYFILKYVTIKSYGRRFFKRDPVASLQDDKEESRNNRSGNSLFIKSLFIAGIFASLAFLTKQSNGLMITVFSFAGLFVLASLNGIRELVRVCVSYVFGFIIPVTLIALWLLLNGALPSFIDQVFSGAVASKGGLSQIFFSWLNNLFTENFYRRFQELVLLLLVFGYWLNFFIRKREKDEDSSEKYLLIASFIMLFVVVVPLFMNRNVIDLLSEFGVMGVNNIIVAAISAPLLIIVVSFCFLAFRKSFNKGAFLFSFVALGFIYGTGTSAGITQVGAFAGVCLFVAYMLHLKSIFGLGKIFIVLFCFSFCLMLVEAKYEQPYYWWNITSPDVRDQLYTTEKIDVLKGMYTSEENLRLVEEVTRELQDGAKPDEPVLIFPNTPIFYLTSDRMPPGRAAVHWFDFMSDEMAVREAGVIRKNPPKVIVYLDLGPTVWEAHERLFRDGKMSGQREFDKAIKEVIKSEKMHVTKKYNISEDATLTVWRE